MILTLFARCCSNRFSGKMWRANEHGRLFEPGKSLSKDTRLLIIGNIIKNGGNPETGVFPGRFIDIARPLGVSSAVVSKIWKRYWQDKTVDPKPNTGVNLSHLSDGDLHYIEFLKQQKPSITYNEILQKLYEFGDLPHGTTSMTGLSEAVRHRLPSSNKYTFKKLNIIAQERFTLQNMAYTQIFIDYVHSKDPYKLKFFDECGLKLPTSTARKYGHAPVGERAVEFQRYAETPNTTVNLMCSLTGVDYANTVNGSADTLDFLRFFEEAFEAINVRTGEQVLEPGSVIVMDNCAIHHNEGGRVLNEFLNDIDIELVYMPAYSPDFNPAEYVFGKMRTLMKYRFGDCTNITMPECIYNMYTSLESITPGDMQGFFQYTGYIEV